jgi:hypothetical protein
MTYCQEYDAHYEEDGTWITRLCDDQTCIYCNSRPPFHLDDCQKCLIIKIDKVLRKKR